MPLKYRMFGAPDLANAMSGNLSVNIAKGKPYATPLGSPNVIWVNAVVEEHRVRIYGVSKNDIRSAIAIESPAETAYGVGALSAT